MQQKKFSLRKGIRIFTALFLTVLTLWMISLTADLSGAKNALEALGEKTAFAAAVVRTELGLPRPESGEAANLTFWQKIVVSQSPALLAAALDENTSAPEETPEPEPSEQIPETSASADRVVERTVAPKDTTGYTCAGEVYIQNPTAAQVDAEAMTKAAVPVTLGTDGPQVLIVHTHGSEAYTPADGDDYAASSAYRTTDTQYNMVRVGDEIAAVLESRGISVLHDKSLYDYPAYSGAYGRSAAAIEGFLKQYPSIRVILDVHRDAIVDTSGVNYKVVTEVDGEKTAQVMLVVGTDQGGANHPNWRQNLTFAVKVQQHMNGAHENLARPIALRAARYNQQYAVGSLLVEVGSHGNTLREALRGGRLFAEALADTLGRTVAY